MAGCRPRRSRGMARRCGLCMAAAGLAAMLGSAALADDVSFDRPGWAETGWVQVWPVGGWGKGEAEKGPSVSFFRVFVVPERISEREVYLGAGRTLCTTDESCHVSYWSAIDGPLKKEMPAASEGSHLGIYSRRRGRETLDVRCEVANIEGCKP